MEFVSVIAAAAGAFGFGAVWYSAMSRAWIDAAEIPADAAGKPLGSGSKAPFVVGIVAMVVVAGMMRHIFQMAAIDTPGKAALAGFGIGAFFVVPWMAMNYAFAMRRSALTVIDGINIVAGCTIMAVILTLL